MRDDRTPNPDEMKIQESNIVELANSIALSHYSRIYRPQFEHIQSSLVTVIKNMAERLEIEKDQMRRVLNAMPNLTMETADEELAESIAARLKDLSQTLRLNI